MSSNNALAYKEDEYDYPNVAAYSDRTQGVKTRSRLNFVVVGAANQEQTALNSHASAQLETTTAELDAVEVAPSFALPTNEASQPRQWRGGSSSEVAAPSSFAVDYATDNTRREWQANATELSVPAYDHTLRPRRTHSRKVIQVQASEMADQVEILNYETAQPIYTKAIPRTSKARATIQPQVEFPTLPTFFGATEYHPTDTIALADQFSTSAAASINWISRNKLVAALVIVAVFVVWVVMQAGASSKSDNGPVYAYGGTAASVSSADAPQAAPSSGNGDSLLSAPSITPSQIDQVLSQYHSPATGVGQAMYNFGQQYGIDPAFALAFFIHESSAGTKGVATVTKSIGNIRVTAGYASYEGYRKYPTWQAGIEDWYKLIKGLYIDSWHLTTLQAIVPRYAPSADHNDPLAYINQVHNLVASWRSNK